MNKLILVTGATGGIGKEYSNFMLAKGFDLVLTYRNKEAGLALQKDLQEAFPHAMVDAMMIDLSSMASIQTFADAFSKKYSHLDVLVHNAGVYFFDQEKRISKDGFELNMTIHLISPYVLTGLLLPILKATPHSKIISMSSTEHKASHFDVSTLTRTTPDTTFNNGTAYADSKFALLVFAQELNRLLQKNHLDILSLAAHPGVSITGIQHKGNPTAFQKMIISLIGKTLAGSPMDAARPLVMATLTGQGGEYYGPTGFKEARGKAGLVSPHPKTKDEQLGHNLWLTLEKLTGISYPFLTS